MPRLGPASRNQCQPDRTIAVPTATIHGNAANRRTASNTKPQPTPPSTTQKLHPASSRRRAVRIPRRSRCVRIPPRHIGNAETQFRITNRLRSNAAAAQLPRRAQRPRSDLSTAHFRCGPLTLQRRIANLEVSPSHAHKCTVI